METALDGNLQFAGVPCCRIVGKRRRTLTWSESAPRSADVGRSATSVGSRRTR